MSSSITVAMLVERERPLLDEIFGAGQYEIEDPHPDAAIIRSSEFELSIGYERYRDLDLGIYVTLLGLPLGVPSQTNPLSTWCRFLDEDYPVPPRDARGFIEIPADVLLRNELSLFARFKREIFSDPQSKRDAAFFAMGYNKDYNDRASRQGRWSEGL